MTRKVRTAMPAARALRQAQLWLLQPGSGQNAGKRALALRHVARYLRDHPYAGRVIPQNPTYRQLIVSGYVLIYRIDPDTGRADTAGDIEIVDVFGPAQEQNAP